MSKRTKIVTVTVTQPWHLCCDNSVGGTESLPSGTYRVKVTASWHDYETGQRNKGLLVDQKDIDLVRKRFTIPNTTHHSRENGWQWNPAQVYF